MPCFLYATMINTRYAYIPLIIFRVALGFNESQMLLRCPMLPCYSTTVGVWRALCPCPNSPKVQSLLASGNALRRMVCCYENLCFALWMMLCPNVTLLVNHSFYDEMLQMINEINELQDCLVAIDKIIVNVDL